MGYDVSGTWLDLFAYLDYFCFPSIYCAFLKSSTLNEISNVSLDQMKTSPSSKFQPHLFSQKGFFFLSIRLLIMGEEISPQSVVQTCPYVMDVKFILPPRVDEQEHLLFGSSGRPVLFEVLTRSIAEASRVIFLQKKKT